MRILQDDLINTTIQQCNVVTGGVYTPEAHYVMYRPESPDHVDRNGLQGVNNNLGRQRGTPIFFLDSRKCVWLAHGPDHPVNHTSSTLRVCAGAATVNLLPCSSQIM